MAGHIPAALSNLRERTFAMEEIWKDIEGYEGLYQISNLGNVRSLNWKKSGERRNLWLKPHNKGYLQVELSKCGVKKCFVVHRLVAGAFIPNPDNLPQVNHIDEIKTNNAADNLEWCTRSYNVRYSLNSRKSNTRNGSKTNMPIQQLTIDGDVVKTWRCSRDIFVETGMSDWSISECCRGKRKTAYGYKWQYAS
jgi:hypothetical protein